MGAKIELRGKRFHRYVVLGEAGRAKDGSILWKCICDCGTVKVIGSHNLRSGVIKSCGCLMKEMVREQIIKRNKTKWMREINKIDLSGQKFGRLIVLEEAGCDKLDNVMWKCRCDCGTIKTIRGDSLRSGHTQSCGCLQKEKAFEAFTGKNNPNFGKDFSGSNSSRWNPYLTDEERQIARKYPEYYEWLKDVYERDDYTCQCCGDNKGGNLNAHHLEAYANNPELRVTIENGVTLCDECHVDFHRQYGYGNNTNEQFEEFRGGIHDCQIRIN